jgi:arginase family enzyme
VGFDIVCLNPLVDTAWYGGITSRLVSYVMAYTLGYVFDSRRSATLEPATTAVASAR